MFLCTPVQCRSLTKLPVIRWYIWCICFVFFCVVSGDLFHQFYSGSPYMCCRFMENLQSEVLELEFKEFSKGMPTISEVDFARILLRYTLLDRSEINECVERVRERVPHEKVRYKQYEHGLSVAGKVD